MKKNKQKSSNKKSLFTSFANLFVTIGKEIITTFKYVGLALFKIFDFIITNLMSIITYVLYSFVYIFEYIGKFTIKVGDIVYNHFLKKVALELYYLFRAFGIGIYKTLKLCFYDFPTFIFKKLSNFFDSMAKKSKSANDKLAKFMTDAPKAVANYFVNKFNNISIVKHYRNKKERELEVLLVDKFGKDAERSEKKLVYKYLARNKEGKLVKGYFGALSKLDVHSYLIDEGYEVYEIKTNWWINFTHGESKYISHQMKNKDLIFWLAQVSTYLKSGIPLTDAVKILAEQDKRKKYKKVYDSIIYELSMGESFSEALKKQGSTFPALLINMVKAAELIGDLETTLDEMSEYYNEKETTKKQMISAITYPAVILVFTIAVTTFMLVYIVPQFSDVYKSLGTEINPLTKGLLSFSAFLKANGITLLMIAVASIILIIILYKRVKAFRTLLQYIYMHIPVLGKLVIYNEMNMFAKTFAVLNKNNVLLTDSMDILSKITNNEFYKMIMYDTISNLLRGEKVSESFKDNWAVPSLAYYMIATGESTGELGQMLEKVSEYYQREQRALAGTLKTLIEPVLMVILAVIVGGIMIAILVPMYQVGEGILT